MSDWADFHRDIESFPVEVSDLDEARVLAAIWRDKFCKLAAGSSGSYEGLRGKYPLPWENDKGLTSADTNQKNNEQS